jgi:hypothetical protein
MAKGVHGTNFDSLLYIDFIYLNFAAIYSVEFVIR